MEPTNTNPVWPSRVLDLTRTTVVYRDLEAGVEALAKALAGDIFPLHRDDAASLLEALTDLHTTTTDQWLKDKPMHWGFYDDTRQAAIARALQLQALAADVATAAHRIAALLAELGPLDTVERLSMLITEAGSCLEDGRDTPDLGHLWHRLGPSELIDDAGAVRLRRQFDVEIDYTADTTLANAVTAWRAGHLAGEEGPITWDYETFGYVITTIRSWADLVGVWERISTAAHAGMITAAEGLRLRDTIAARVRAAGSTPAMPEQLRQALADYDTNSISLSARIRLADDVATLENVWAVLREDAADLERLGMVRALLRRTRKMQLAEHDAAERSDNVEYQTLNRLDSLMSELNDWHMRLFHLAGDIAEGRGDHYSHDEAYTILYNALAAAEDTGNAARRTHLLGCVEHARRRGRLTEDQHARIAGMGASATRA